MDTNNLNGLIESTRVVIVGAGIAGLGAALKLEQSNFKDYILLEAQSQVGGRICSIPWRNGWLEKGAQFLHGTESTLGELIIEKDLLSDMEVSEGQGLYYREDGTVVQKKAILDIDDCIKRALEKCEAYANSGEIQDVKIEDNIGEVLRKQLKQKLKNKDPPCKKIIEELFGWNYKFIVIDNACASLDDLSVERWGDYKAVGGPEYNAFKSHYGSITESIVRDLTQENIRLNSPVIKIEWDSSVTEKYTKSVVITLENSKKVVADCAIVTCSLGFLKENHESLFSPPLPLYYSNVIENMGFGVINKVFLDFDEPWWGPKTKGFQFLWSTDTEDNNRNCFPGRDKVAAWTRDLTGFDVVQTHSAVLIGWIGGKGAEFMETLNEQQVIDDCTKLLRYFLKDESIPEASRCLRTCWGSNEFVRGAYCHITKKCDLSGSTPGILAEPICRKIKVDKKIEKSLPILMLAGEATHKHFYSTTHGAYDSGVTQAQIFLRDHVVNRGF